MVLSLCVMKYAQGFAFYLFMINILAESGNFFLPIFLKVASQTEEAIVWLLYNHDKQHRGISMIT